MMYDFPQHPHKLSSNIVDLMYRFPTLSPFNVARKLLAAWAIEDVDKQWPIQVVEILESENLDEISNIIWQNFSCNDVWYLFSWIEGVMESLYENNGKDIDDLRLLQAVGLVSSDKEGAEPRFIKMDDITKANYSNFKKLVC